jgi:glycyl-tRNA synthetase beta chain
MTKAGRNEMTDFLLELLSEEIPARMQDKARDDLARLFSAELDKAGLKAADLITYATPRRLALIAKGLPLETQAVSEETKGPKVGAPPQAMEGFLRKTGLTQDQLVERDGVYFAVVEKPGRKTADVLAEAIPTIIRAFPWPKSQRWGAASRSTESLRWVRPLQGIIALLGDDVVPCEIDGITSGATTMGHRFHHTGPVTIGNAGDYAAKLKAAHVIVDQDERRAIIRAGAEKAAADAGLVLVPDEGLVNENSGLTEWPVPMLGRFDPDYLTVPEEVIQLTARVNQKYFVCQFPARLREGLGEGESLPDTGPPPTPPAGGRGALANAFICTANIVANDGGAMIVAGNEKVLAARLSDARFFYDTDLKTSLEVHAEKLKDIVFHEKLGTVADKVERVAKLARWLVEKGIVKPLSFRGGVGGGDSPSAPKSPAPHPNPSPEGEGLSLADMAERAALLAKADLVTGMVGEFPELQGLMGGYYAAAQGEPAEVAAAVRDHYKPVGQGDEVPTAPVTVAVSLADKLDTVGRFFAIEEYPTGSKDPFALRRAVLGIIALVLHNNLRFGYGSAAFFSITGGTTISELDTVSSSFMRPYSTLESFFADRLKVQQKEAGVRHDLIDAVFALGGEDDLVRLLARVKALQAFVTTEDGTNLLAGYKRAANILKQSEGDSKDTVRPEPVEGPSFADSPKQDGASTSSARTGVEDILLSALDAAEQKATAAIDAERFGDAMAALATLRGPIDTFFDAVMVNDPDPHKRAFRLGLLARFRDAVHRVADFSKIEG